MTVLSKQATNPVKLMWTTFIDKKTRPLQLKEVMKKLWLSS